MSLIFTLRKWILDAVPAVGTLDALKFIKKIFLADELSIPEFTQVLLATVHMVTANLDTIKIYSVRTLLKIDSKLKLII